MDLSPVKREILEALLMQDKPEKAAQVAKEVGKEFRPVQMHLIGLTRMGYADSPEKGHFVITEKGKHALGMPEISKENAGQLLTQSPCDKAFHFYAGIGKPLNLSAHNLRDFGDKLAEVNVESVEFHLGRGDFEAWFACLGDAELARKTSSLREKKLVGEELRAKLLEIVKNRCVALSKMAENATSSP